jgi:hypothetical protein
MEEENVLNSVKHINEDGCFLDAEITSMFNTPVKNNASDRIDVSTNF